jgi:hypothetical protein
VNTRSVKVAAGQADGILPRTIEVLQVCLMITSYKFGSYLVLTSWSLELWSCWPHSSREQSNAYGCMFSHLLNRRIRWASWHHTNRHSTIQVRAEGLNELQKYRVLLFLVFVSHIRCVTVSSYGIWPHELSVCSEVAHLASRSDRGYISWRYGCFGTPCRPICQA